VPARCLRLVTALVVVVAVACSGGSSGDETDSTDPANEGTDSPVPISGCDTSGASTIPRRSPRAASRLALLTAVEVTQEGCFDVVRFEFEEGGVGAGLPPAYVVEYQDGPFLVGEGEAAEEIDIAGTAFIVVTLESATRTLAPPDEEPTLTYGGPTSFVPGFEHIQEVMLVVDAPDLMRWVIGVAEEGPFVVDAASGPPRVTVKVA
jgi:hypothetical protein